MSTVTYKSGQLYLVRNTATLAGGYFNCREAIPYLGHIVACGVMEGYGVHLWRGIGEYSGKPVAVAQPNLERHGQKGIDAYKILLSKICGEEQKHGVDAQGYPGRLRVSALPPGKDRQSGHLKQAEGPEEPWFTAGRQVALIFGGTNFIEGWGGTAGMTPNWDGLVSCSRKMLDLYEDVVRLGYLPAWFVNQRNAVAQQLQQVVA